MGNTPYLEITLSPGALARLHAFADFPTILEPALAAAMDESTALLQEWAYAYMWATFKEPEGNLEDSLGRVVISPYQAWMGTDSPYGRRRNWGFSGMTDSLGRYFAHDPGIEWAERTLDANVGKIETRFSRALLESASQLELGMH